MFPLIATWLIPVVTLLALIHLKDYEYVNAHEKSQKDRLIHSDNSIEENNIVD